jgi:hypothetical protein
MFALAALPDNSPVAPTAAVAAMPFSPEQFAADIEPSPVALNLRFRRIAACIFRRLRTLLRTHFSVCSLFSAPCALFRALFFELPLCFQYVAQSLLRSFALVRILSPALSSGCALFRKNTREGVGVPILENPGKRVLNSRPVANHRSNQSGMPLRLKEIACLSKWRSSLALQIAP